MSFALIQPFKESVILLKITYGMLAPVLVTLSKTPKLWKGEIYRPEPGVKIELPKQTGGFSEDPAKVTLPLLRRAVHPDLNTLAVSLSKPTAHPNISMQVVELLKSSEVDIKALHLLEGTVSKIRRNPSGRRGVVDLEVDSSLKAGLKDISLGRRCDGECDLIFGGPGCGVDNKQFFTSAQAFPNQFGVIRRIWVRVAMNTTNPRQVTLTIDSVQHPLPLDFRIITVQPPDWWLKSYLEKDGLRITVQQWVQNQAGGTSTFNLNRIPPASWQNALAVLIPDCPKHIDACGQRNNQANFGGLGRGMPAYNPALEQP